MKESFGGLFLVRLLLIFLAIYIAMLCFVYSYMKAFKANTKVVDILEQCEGYNDCSYDLIPNFLENFDYNVNLANENKKISDIRACVGGCCFEYLKSDSVFKVTTYMSVELPIFNILWNIPVSMKSKTITNPNNTKFLLHEDGNVELEGTNGSETNDAHIGGGILNNGG